jgi:formylglycine-generating enzyme required for sulfatase activity
MPPGLEEASRSRTHPQGPCYKEITLAYLAFLHLLLLIDPQLFGRAAPVYFAYHARIEPLSGMVLLPIGPGTFLMGSPENEAGRFDWEGPRHSVTLSRAFWLGRYPVTQAEYAKVMGQNPSKFKGEDRPVEQVSWEEAVEFCRRLTEQARGEGSLPAGYEYRLPTEAEWEYCCRAGGTGAYCYGDDEARLADHAWYDRNSNRETHEVGLKKANSWGLHDMHGNVWEWCLDAWDWGSGYKNEDGIVDPLSDSGQERVLRGGSWFDTGRLCRSAYRNANEPAFRFGYLGFRVCLAPQSGRQGSP